MVQQMLSIVMMLSVNMLILTHAVIPHHHHHGIPHFVLCENHAEDATDCCCHSDLPTGNNHCQLEQPLDFFLAQHDDHHHCVICCLHHTHSPLLQAVLLSFSYDLTALKTQEPLRFPPYLISYTGNLPSDACGLRAPPSKL
ncbi:MAG: hypothetical protein LBR66_09225 [Candidatus Symbiothrix sp.]|nr:hypothetical protein [Candidatus Symbiothrix sp.]